MVRCVQAKLCDAQKVKKQLLEQNVINHNYRADKDTKYIYFPVKDSFNNTEFDIVNREVNKSIRKEITARPFKEVLSEILNPQELEIAKTAYEHMGSIAIIEVPEPLEHKEKEIGKALLDSNHLIKTVLRKAGGHDGVFRSQKMKFLAGENTRIAQYKENNCILQVDVQEVYYSSRLATERKRICEHVRPKEHILVMFSGAAPYPVVLSKNSPAQSIIGVEINPKGHEFGLKNVAKNKCKNIDLFCGDVRTIVPTLQKTFDRIIMPLPKTAEEFLDVALPVANKNCVIHMYAFYHEDEFDRATKEINRYCESVNREYEILGITKVGQQSPRTYRICVDFRLLN